QSRTCKQNRRRKYFEKPHNHMPGIVVGSRQSADFSSEMSVCKEARFHETYSGRQFWFRATSWHLFALRQTLKTHTTLAGLLLKITTFCPLMRHMTATTYLRRHPSEVKP